MTAAEPKYSPPSEQDTHVAILRRLLNAGLRARCIYDIGASNGSWASVARSVFPLAELHLFEPLAEYEDSYRRGLQWVCSTPGVRASVHAVAVDREGGTSALRMPHDPVGSSLLPPDRSEYFPNAVEVPTVSLDEFSSDRGLMAPQLIKLDTQGSELRILQGAARLLKSVDAIVVELWTWPAYGPTTPLFSQVSQWLLLQGFLIADFGRQFLDEEGRLIAVDVVFTRSWLRPKSVPSW